MIYLDAGLIETVKWGHPCYMFTDCNIVIIGTLRGDFRLSFFNAALMKDPEGVLEKQGPNTQPADMIRFTDNAQVAAMKPIIQSYLEETKEYAEAGIKPPEEKVAIELPIELVDAMDADPELAEAFHGLTPGRQRSYVRPHNLQSLSHPSTRLKGGAKMRLEEELTWQRLSSV